MEARMIGKERFGKLFEGKPVIRTMYDPAGREDVPTGFENLNGRLEPHSTYYVFSYEDKDGHPLSSKGGYRNIQLDEDEKGFRLPFLHSYDGHVGYHYRLREDT